MTKDRPRFDVLAQMTALRRYARSLTRDETDAEDLVHDALVRAYERRSSFREGGSVRTWLFSILHNVFVDRRRARRAEMARIEQVAELQEREAAPHQEQQLRLAQVRRAFMDLPEEQRAALHLVAIEGLTFAEAAGALGIPIGTLMSRLARARAALRQIEDGVPAGRPREKGQPHLRIVGGSDGPSA
ncbi:sigma-70 family RNA polymerase sigma factor [Prosthecomicrobium pneumaticum]|uniref:RNA polymerase sigma-70 factor (ECF subfamily) n=1 Tax=Prosthecomicrobium pneumaticum TaxID=81895 RepID=A0A7W9CTI4_9HYPH|nr:sigma-70 family RNA polymerase sigma factor [Prosthecomicrobium pneumaticum]MBB5751366.1 RNA polymerase sigma-70 factor (ECF subfamily) [Prosthecomicrobium pneumaticum]